MEKTCQNCRYFEFGKCYNNDVLAMIPQNKYSGLIDFVEQGYVSDIIEEHAKFTKIGDNLINDLYTLGYIKMSKKVLNGVHDIDKNFMLSYDDDVKLFVETVLLTILNDKIQYNCIQVDKDFKCKFWD